MECDNDVDKPEKFQKITKIRVLMKNLLLSYSFRNFMERYCFYFNKGVELYGLSGLTREFLTHLHIFKLV